MRKHIKHKHVTLIFSISCAIAIVLALWDPFSFTQAGTIRYYGHYFVEDPDKNQAYIQEVKDWTNLINMRYDNGANNSWDYNAASRVRNSGVKVMLQIPFGTDSDQTLFVNSSDRRTYLNKIKQDMLNTNFMSSLAYIAIYEEWYVLISQGFYDKWPIFQGHTKEEKFIIAKKYLEDIINDVHEFFPGIPTIIVENILPYPTPPSNVDVLGVDAYYIPENSSCDATQRAKFEREVLPYFDAAVPYNKPLMMVPPSFVGGPWKMLSECQMQWYSDLARSGQYNIESFLWFFWADTSSFTGVRNYSNLVNYQKVIACQILGGSHCVVPTPTPTPTSTPAPSQQTFPLGQLDLRSNSEETDSLLLSNGTELVIQRDGNLVVYDSARIPLWHSVTWSQNCQDLCKATFQPDGNFVLYNNGTPYFASMTNGRGATSFVFNQDAPYLKVLSGSTTLWTSNDGNKISTTPTPTPSGPVRYTVNLRANNGQYVVAEGNGGGAVNANRNNASVWETFTLTDVNGGQLVSGDQVGFSTSDSYYLRAINGGGSTMDAATRSLGSSETFRVEKSGGGVISNGDTINLRTSNGTHFVVAELGGGDVVNANRTAAYAWEAFTLIIAGQTPSTPPASGYSVSGYVYRDSNSSTCCGGVKDPGESGLSGRTVYLRDQADTVDIKSPAVTDSGGFYQFTNVPAGNYRIRHSVPDGYIRTTDDSKTFNLGSNFTYNFGLYRP